MKRGIIILSKVLTDVVIKITQPKHINRIVIILPYLLFIYQHITPRRYEHLQSIILINKSYTQSLKPLIHKTFWILVHINSMVLQGIAIIIICFIFQMCIVSIGGLIQRDISENNRTRKRFCKYFGVIYIYISVLLYSIAIYCEMLLDIPVLLDVVNKAPVSWVSGIPFKITGLIILWGLIVRKD